jgi:hypothetical protein
VKRRDDFAVAANISVVAADAAERTRVSAAAADRVTIDSKASSFLDNCGGNL